MEEYLEIESNKKSAEPAMSVEEGGEGEYERRAGRFERARCRHA
jgi:hypothetical protein